MADPILDNWRLVRPSNVGEPESYVLKKADRWTVLEGMLGLIVGTVQGHPDFPDGHLLCTSPIVEIATDKSRVKTTDSIFRLGRQLLDGAPSWDDDQKLLAYLGVAFVTVELGDMQTQNSFHGRMQIDDIELVVDKAEDPRRSFAANDVPDDIKALIDEALDQPY